MEFFGASEPMYVPVPRNLCTAPYGAMTISECLEPRSVPSPKLMPRSKFWSPEDTQIKPKQGVNCFNPPVCVVPVALPVGSQEANAYLCEQEAVANEEKENVISGVNLNVQPLSKEVAEMSLKAASNPNRWWTLSRIILTCPLTGFPIHLLPYPPFKLRVHADKPWPHVLVDGKFLALHLIGFDSLVQVVQSRTSINGRH